MLTRTRNITGYLVAFAVALSLPLSAQAITIDLDFGTSIQSSFGTKGNLTLSYESVADGINATITAASKFRTHNTTMHGSENGDARINMAGKDANVFTLRLWDATSGTGFDSLYDPGVDYDWSLGFYDIDGNSKTYDVVTLFEPIEYSVTASTALIIDESKPGQISFSGQAAGGIAGQTGLEPPITQAQADVSVIAVYHNTSEVIFGYAHKADKNNRGRNILIDGGGLRFALEDPSPSPVPAPATLWLLGSALLGLAAVRRRKV